MLSASTPPWQTVLEKANRTPSSVEGHYSAWHVYAWVALGLATVFIAAIAAASVRLVTRNADGLSRRA